MYAFSLVECGDYALAEQSALGALAANPSDARAHHVMAHVFEMTGRADAGVRWMETRASGGRHGRLRSSLPGSIKSCLRKRQQG
jgi:hypothetical protein